MTLSATARVTLGLGFTQIVGWGTTYLMPSVLGRHLQDDLGISSELVFAGITVMFAVNAICSPRVGKVVDRIGARSLMAGGSVIYALALVGVSMSRGATSYLACWAVMGVASTLALSTPASIAIVQVAGPRSRQATAMLTIIGGLASTMFWPLTGLLDAAVGWRFTLLLYATIHLLACLPIHLLILPRRPPVHPPAANTSAIGGAVAPDDLGRVFLLLSISLAFGAFVFTGVQLQMIEILRGLGLSPAQALLLASMIGPAQVSVRAFELVFGHRYSIMRSAVFGSVMLPVASASPSWPATSSPERCSVVVTYGMSNGLKAVQRATLLLALFGRAQFGAYMGRLALPQGIVSAVSPPIMAAMLRQVLARRPRSGSPFSLPWSRWSP